jgi:hypothetical protein
MMVTSLLDGLQLTINYLLHLGEMEPMVAADGMRRHARWPIRGLRWDINSGKIPPDFLTISFVVLDEDWLLER